MTDQQIIETLATKVMGWERYHQFNIVNDTIFKYDENMDLVEWNPLQNIADAWMIVKKLLSKDLLFELTADEDGWWATFIRVDKTYIDSKKYEIFDETECKAICQAALKVVA